MQVGGLQVVRGQGVAGQQRGDVAVLHELGEGAAGVAVKGEGRAEHPDDLAVLAVVAEHVVELVVVAAEGGLAAAPWRKAKTSPRFRPASKPLGHTRMPSLPSSLRPTITASPARRRRGSRTSMRLPSSTATQSMRDSSASIQRPPTRKYSGKMLIAW